MPSEVQLRTMDFLVSGELEDIFIACTSEQELGERKSH